MFVRAFKLRSNRQTTRAAATSDMSDIGRKKYHSSVTNLDQRFMRGFRSVRVACDAT